MICPPRPRVPPTALVMLMLCLAMAGCAASPPRSRADVGAQTACRQRADQAFEEQDRGAVYREDAYDAGLKDAPFSSSGTARNYSRGLPAEYARLDAIQKCLQGIGQAPGTDIQVAPLAPAK